MALFPVNTEGTLTASRWDLFWARLLGAVWEVTAEGYKTRFIVWRGVTYIVSQKKQEEA